MGILEAIAAIIASIAIAFFVGRRGAAKDATRKAKDKDHERAAQIETAADRARAADDAGAGDAVDRLHDANRLRD
jgi:hypothetical protein